MTTVVQNAAAPTLLIACLCAQWCNTCCDYQATFWQTQQHFPEARFVWIDIEDQSELVDSVEVENFPTILISHNGQPRFFGTVMPHSETLRKLIASCQQPNAWSASADVAQLAHKLTAATST